MSSTSISRLSKRCWTGIAYAGYRLGGVWIDGGIFFAHVGMESFISRDNPTYTRSLVADFSPYYQTGVRVGLDLAENLQAQVLLLNGWQTISDADGSKAVGAQFGYSLTDRTRLSYAFFGGREEGGFRSFHDWILRTELSAAWSMAAQFDFGFQGRGEAASASWYGFTLVSRHELSETTALALRMERYSDPDQIIIDTGTGDAFQAWGASLGLDFQLTPRLLWRVESRAIWGDTLVFPSAGGLSRSDVTGVTSLALTL